MSGKIISVHSFRGGTGKSNISANLAYMLAKQGKKVCVIDTDIQSPGIHVLFRIDTPSPGCTLNDYLWGNTEIENVALDVSSGLGLPGNSLYLIPCSVDMGNITRILKQGYDISTLSRGFKDIRSKLGLDYLIVDTHPGLDEETLLSISISDSLLIVLRPDQQDYQGTSVTVEIARRLKVENTLLIVNRLISSIVSPEEMKKKMVEAFSCEVAAVLPDCIDMSRLGSQGILAEKNPESPWVSMLEPVTNMI